MTRPYGLLAAGLAGLVAAAACGPPPGGGSSVSVGGAAAPRAPRHVVLVSLDTTRADRLGCYGSTVRTPTLDGLAAEATVFEDAVTPATTTLCAHTSMLTGSWPQTHGVVRNGYFVHPDNAMLAEVLGAAGFTSAGFVGSFALSERFDFAQGFDHWDETFDLKIRPGDKVANQRRAEQVTDAVLAHLGEGVPERLFLFVHYFDPHSPYDPPPPYDAMYGDVPEGTSGGLDTLRVLTGERQTAVLGFPRDKDAAITEGLLPELVRGWDPEPSELERDLVRLYEGEVSYLDAHLGRLFDGLREAGVWDDALVVVTADHGETFHEHADCWNHGLGVYDTTVRVPLIVRAPGRGAGARVAQVVSTIDVAPTVLDLLGLEPGPRVDGHSLAPLLEGGRLEREHVFAVGTQPGARVERAAGEWRNACKAHAVRSADHKLIETPYMGLQELYDLRADPGEQHELLLAQPAESRAVAAGLAEALARFRASARPLPSDFADPNKTDQRELQQHDLADTARRLQELGYVEAGEDADEDPAAPDCGG